MSSLSDLKKKVIANNAREILERIKELETYRFKCAGGPLTGALPWYKLRKAAERLAKSAQEQEEEKEEPKRYYLFGVGNGTNQTANGFIEAESRAQALELLGKKFMYVYFVAFDSYAWADVCRRRRQNQSLILITPIF